MNFVLIIRRYNLFQSSARVGDAITVEWIYNLFITVWLSLGKHTYQSTGLSQIDKLYSRLPYLILQQLRENRFLPSYNRTNLYGTEMKEWELVKVMELINGKYKDMDFNKDLDGWMRRSQNLTLCTKSRVFVENEYCYNSDVSVYIFLSAMKMSKMSAKRLTRIRA